MTHPPPPSGKPNALRAIGWSGLIAGALDITCVIVFYGLKSAGGISATGVSILQGIAGGLLGPAARQGGLEMAGLGLFLHFVIAYGAAAVFYAASRRLPALLEHAVISGLLYGIAVWLFMNLVVLPLSAVPPRASFPPPGWIPVFVAHLLCVGLPIALTVRHCSKQCAPPPPVSA